MGARPTVVSVFAGCGGSSLGYKWAGFRELLAIDFDENAVKTFELNFPKVPIWQRDIGSVTVKSILKFCKIKKGELGVLDGSPPCQGFSTAGKRKIGDPRNDLFLEFVRLIKGIRPKVFLMENVPGMIKGRMKGQFVEIMKTLKGTGYDVRCRLMNSVHYDVPQFRKRLIWIGARSGAVSAGFPIPSREIISVRKAWKKLANDEKQAEWLSDIKNSSIYPTLLRMRPGESYAKYKGQGFNFSKIRPDRPSPTITSTMWNKYSTNGLIHPTKHRKLTIPEAKRLASFPDDFRFVGKYEKQWNQIGNAVMPKFMRAIAACIKSELLGKPGKGKITLDK